MTQLSAHALLFTVRSIDLVLLDLREHWQIDPGDFDRKVALRQAEARIDIPFAISVIGPDGRVASSSANPAAIGTDLSDQPYVGANGNNSAYGDLTILGPMEGRPSGYGPSIAAVADSRRPLRGGRRVLGFPGLLHAGSPIRPLSGEKHPRDGDSRRWRRPGVHGRARGPASGAAPPTVDSRLQRWRHLRPSRCFPSSHPARADSRAFAHPAIRSIACRAGKSWPPIH